METYHNLVSVAPGSAIHIATACPRLPRPRVSRYELLLEKIGFCFGGRDVKIDRSSGILMTALPMWAPFHMKPIESSTLEASMVVIRAIVLMLPFLHKFTNCLVAWASISKIINLS